MHFEIIRDPLWNNIRVDDSAMRLVDTGVVQRLRYVRQLGLAYLVYPGATHNFAVPGVPGYDPAVAELSEQRAFTLFDRLKGAP